MPAGTEVDAQHAMAAVLRRQRDGGVRVTHRLLRRVHHQNKAAVEVGACGRRLEAGAHAGHHHPQAELATRRVVVRAHVQLQPGHALACCAVHHACDCFPQVALCLKALEDPVHGTREATLSTQVRAEPGGSAGLQGKASACGPGCKPLRRHAGLQVQLALHQRQGGRDAQRLVPV